MLRVVHPGNHTDPAKRFAPKAISELTLAERENELTQWLDDASRQLQSGKEIQKDFAKKIVELAKGTERGKTLATSWPQIIKAAS